MLYHRSIFIRMLFRLLILYSIPLILFAIFHATLSGDSEITKGRKTRARRILFGSALLVLIYALMHYWWEIYGNRERSDKLHSNSHYFDPTQAKSKTSASISKHEGFDNNAQTGTSGADSDSRPQPPPLRHNRIAQFFLHIRPIVTTILLVFTMLSFWTNMFWCDREPTWIGVISYTALYFFLQLFVLCIYLIVSHLALRRSQLPARFPKAPWRALRLLPALLYLILSTSFAFYYGAIEPRVVEVALRFPRGLIPDQFNGYRIAQLTDIHLGTSMINFCVP